MQLEQNWQNCSGKEFAEESQNQIISVKQRFREATVKELRDVKLEVSDLYEQLLVAKDVLQRIEIKAPRGGIVQALQFHTIGVVGPGEPLMEIVPQDDDLIVNAEVSPNDVDNVTKSGKQQKSAHRLEYENNPGYFRGCSFYLWRQNSR